MKLIAHRFSRTKEFNYRPRFYGPDRVLVIDFDTLPGSWFCVCWLWWSYIAKIQFKPDPEAWRKRVI